MSGNVKNTKKKNTTKAKSKSSTPTQTKSPAIDKVMQGALIVLYILAFLSLLIIGYYFYYLESKPETVGTAYTDVLTYTQDQPFIAEVKYFSNQANNGKECFEFRMNYYTDTTIPSTPDEYKNVYSSGMQLFEDFTFNYEVDPNWVDKSVRYWKPNNPIYYNSTNGTSYEAVNSLSYDDKWIVDFSGDLGLLVQTEPVDYQQILWVHRYFRYDINALVLDLYNSVKSLDNGKFILQYDFSKYFNVKKYNTETGQFDTDITTDNKFVFCNVVVEKSENGIVEADQSLFGIVNKKSNWSYSGAHNENYWEAMTNYSLTLADFDIVEINYHQYLKLKDEAISYLSSFGDLIINAVIDLDSTYLLENNIDIYGFVENAFGELNITSLSISSSVERTLYYTGTLPPTHLVNVTLVEGGDV